jgi:hypothetical protein
LVSTRVPTELYRSLAADAATLGTSISAIVRMYLRTGHAPKFQTIVETTDGQR